jgi:hypothetical protein
MFPVLPSYCICLHPGYFGGKNLNDTLFNILCKCLSLVGTPALQTAAMLDCLVTIKATINVLQKCKNEITDLLSEDDIITSLLQRFVKVIVNILKNGKIECFS